MTHELFFPLFAQQTLNTSVHALLFMVMEGIIAGHGCVTFD